MHRFERNEVCGLRAIHLPSCEASAWHLLSIEPINIRLRITILVWLVLGRKIGLVQSNCVWRLGNSSVSRVSALAEFRLISASVEFSLNTPRNLCCFWFFKGRWYNVVELRGIRTDTHVRHSFPKSYPRPVFEYLSDKRLNNKSTEATVIHVNYLRLDVDKCISHRQALSFRCSSSSV